MIFNKEEIRNRLTKEIKQIQDKIKIREDIDVSRMKKEKRDAHNKIIEKNMEQYKMQITILEQQLNILNTNQE